MLAWTANAFVLLAILCYAKRPFAGYIFQAIGSGMWAYIGGALMGSQELTILNLAFVVVSLYSVIHLYDRKRSVSDSRTASTTD